MKQAIKKIAKGERGHGMDLVLVLLLAGGLISAALLSYMGSGLLVGEVYAARTAELYAADAGVEDAMWKIQAEEVVLCPGAPTYDYSMAVVNDRSVEVTITLVDGHDGPGDTTGMYRIESTATGSDNASSTVTAYTAVSYLDFSGICDYAITSTGNITIEGGDTVINGDVYLPDEDDLYDPKNAINGTVWNSTEVSITWPAFDELDRFYWPDVSDLDPGDPAEVIIVTEEDTIDNPYPIGPYLADVENAEWLLIQKQAEVGVRPWVKLEGTLYVKGNFCLGSNINLDLNGCTIFATGTITLSPTSMIYGSGCIIARSDIDFQPELSCEEGQYVLVLSIEGTTTLQPDSDFQGTIAGSVEVQVQPGNELVWVSPYERGLDFPLGEDEYPMVGELGIASWEVSAA